VTVIEPVNLYGCAIGEGCFIGPFVEIQRGAKIGKFCKIQSHAFICELVEIGDHCFVSHGAMFINDPFASGGPAGGNRNLWKSTAIGDHVSIGTNATILPCASATGLLSVPALSSQETSPSRGSMPGIRRDCCGDWKPET